MTAPFPPAVSVPSSPVPRREPGKPPSLALGCLNFGKRTPEAEARSIIDRALERGIHVLDTANVYNDGESERVVGRAIRGRRDQFLVATKVGLARIGDRPEGLSKAAILRAVDESLARLGTDFIDIYYLHVPDHGTPIEETLAAIETIFEAGKIRSLGVSNYAAWQILEMRHTPTGLGPSISQVVYNLLLRQIDVEYAAYTRRYPIHTTVYNPLAGGLLTGRHHGGEAPAGSRFDNNAMYQRRYWTERYFSLVESYRAIATDFGMGIVDLSYAWIAQREVVDSILVGPGSLEHLDAAVDAVAKTLPKEACERIDATHRAFLGTDTNYVR